MIRKAEKVQVRLDAALRIEQKCVAARSRCELLDLVGGEIVKQAGTIAAAYGDSSTPGKVDPRHAVAQRLVTIGHTFSLGDAFEVVRNQDDRETADYGAEHLPIAPHIPRLSDQNGHCENVKRQ